MRSERPSRERARQVRIVPIPIDRGLLGGRVLLIRRGECVRFANIENVNALRVPRGIQDSDWPDLPILCTATG